MTRLELETFLAIARYQTISNAAQQLYITQPVLSRRLKALEEELGYALVKRGRGQRAVVLTPEGEAFVPLAQQWLRLYHASRALGAGQEKPILHLTSIDSVCSFLLPPVVKRIASDENPYRLNLHQLHSVESYEAVSNGLADLALVSDIRSKRGVTVRPAFSGPFVLVGGEAWDEVEEVSPAELDPHKEIRLPWTDGFDAWHAHWFDQRVYPRVELDQMSLLDAFLSGDCYAVVPLMVARRLRGGRLHICRLLDPPEDELVYCLTPEGAENRMVRHFLAVLKQELEGFPGLRCLL